MGLIDKLKLPEVQKVTDLDDASTTLLHAQIIQKKYFLRRLYLDFYVRLQKAITDADPHKTVELGSGGGFIKQILPEVITSDVMNLSTVDRVFSAMDMPFADKELDAIVMIDVLHHIPDVRSFFPEAVRCLKIGGRIAMIEPANTPWSRFIFQHFHHEAFNPNANWEFESEGPLSTANGALPWIVFHRDRDIFEQEFPQLKILKCQCHTPLRYLISGGLTLKQLAPSWSYSTVTGLEFILSPLNRGIGMFETIILEKIA